MPPKTTPVDLSQRRQANLLSLWLNWRLRAAADGMPVVNSVFAKLIGLSPAQFSQHKSGKALGDRLSRQIEVAYGLNPGWLDQEHSETMTSNPHKAGSIELLNDGGLSAVLASLGPGAKLEMPKVEFRTPAGFPSPAADFETDRVDLIEHMGLNQPSTFLARVRGLSMTGKGIDDGDLIVVNRAVEPRHGHIVVAVIDNELTVKTLFQHNGITKLVAANPDFPDIVLKDGQSLHIWGVVTSAIKKLAY
jgi:DNA polymerase V